MKIFLLFYMCDFAVGLTHCYKTTVFLHWYLQFFYWIYFRRIVLAKCCRPFLWTGCKFVWLAVHIVCRPTTVSKLPVYSCSSHLKKTNVRHIGILLSVLISTTSRNFHVILHHATEFRPNRSSGWLPVSYMLVSLPSVGQSLLANQILSRYLKWRLRCKYFRFRNTNLRQFYFWFRSLPVRRNQHVILHQATVFCPNRSPRRPHCGNMTSYPFLKMATATAKYYFRFCICWCHCLQ